MSAHMGGMAHHICTFVLSDTETARVVESAGDLNALQLPCGGVKVLHAASLTGRIHCTKAGHFSPCPSGPSDPAPMLAWILARLRAAAVAEAAGVGVRHSARAEVLADAAVVLDPDLDAGHLLEAARRLGGEPAPDRTAVPRCLSTHECRNIASSFLYQALQLRPTVVPTPDRILSALDQRAEARHGLLVDLALAAGAGLTNPSPDIRRRLELMLDEGRTDTAGMLTEAWNEPLWA